MADEQTLHDDLRTNHADLLGSDVDMHQKWCTAYDEAICVRSVDCGNGSSTSSTRVRSSGADGAPWEAP
jgi:hypothetical protein